jgi:hypothetical protein
MEPITTSIMLNASKRIPPLLNNINHTKNSTFGAVQLTNQDMISHKCLGTTNVELFIRNI